MSESPDHLSTRKEEILALSSIYDELILNADELSGSLFIPVELDSEVPMVSGDREGKARFLPGLQFEFSTDEKYPEFVPPEISLRCSWLSTEKLASIGDDIKSLWMEEICLFTMIDELSEQSKVIFRLERLEVSNEVFEEILRFAQQEELKRFNESTFFCEICLEHKKGVDCFKLPRCGHISCKVKPLTFIKD
jgi:E3 ubiquitin-protein ligase RNF14